MTLRYFQAIACNLLLSLWFSPEVNAQSTPTPVTSLSAVTAQAEALIAQNRSQEALTLLQPLQSDYAGITGFDYVLAQSLLESGNYSESILVFERLLGNNPQFHGARLDLARAYAGLGQYRNASRELDLLVGTNPPQKAIPAIQQLRQVIASRSRSMRMSRYLNVRTTAGYDSNVNSATIVESFLGFDLDSKSQEQDSDFIEAGVEGGLRYKLSQSLSFSGSAGILHRSNSQASFVDATVTTLNLGVHRQHRKNYQSINLSGYQLKVDGKDNSRGANLSGLWLRAFGDVWKFGASGDLGMIRYGNGLQVKDVERMSLGLIGSRVFGPEQRGLITVKVGFGSDDPRTATSRYARDFIHASATATFAFTDKFRSSAFFYYQDSQYDNVFFEQQFSQPREDTLYRVIGSLDWQFRPDWTLSHTLAYTYNDTFINIFEYEKFEAKVRLNYQFH